jgi:hypothetical protein
MLIQRVRLKVSCARRHAVPFYYFNNIISRWPDMLPADGQYFALDRTVSVLVYQELGFNVAKAHCGLPERERQHYVLRLDENVKCVHRPRFIGRPGWISARVLTCHVFQPISVTTNQTFTQPIVPAWFFVIGWHRSRSGAGISSI